MDRYKRFREAMQPKLETPDTEAASTEVQSCSPPRTSTKAAHSADKDLPAGIDSGHADAPPCAPSYDVEVPEDVKDSEPDDTGHTRREVPPSHETREERRDRLMRQLRIAVGPEDLTLALETIHTRHYHTRDSIKAAPTNDAKLEILRLHRNYLFEISIQHLHRHGCVSFQCVVAYAKLAAPMSRGLPITDRPWDNPTARVVAWACSASWGVSPSKWATFADGSSTLVFQEQVLIEGPKPITRIHVRSDLSGLDVLSDTFVAIEGEKRGAVVVRQYSFMAFARFYYNRICKAVDGDYDPLPAPLTASVLDAGPTTFQNPATQQLDGRLAIGGPPIVGPSSAVKLSAEASLPSLHDVITTPKIMYESRATLMCQLWAAITPHQNPTIGPREIFTDDDWLAWTGAVDQHAKNQILWLAQLRSAVCALSALARKE
jgi:hypothetical protein